MTDDDSSAPKKPGFLRRLFGGVASVPEAAPAPVEPLAPVTPADRSQDVAQEASDDAVEDTRAAELAWDTAPFAGPATPEALATPEPDTAPVEPASLAADATPANPAEDDGRATRDEAPPLPDTATPRPSLWSRLAGPAAPADPSAAPVDAAPTLPDQGLADPDGADDREQAPATRATWWSRLKQGMSRSSSSIGTGIADIFTKRKLDAGTLEDLDDILIRADLGIATASRITDAIGKDRFDKAIDPEDIKAILAREVERVLKPLAVPLVIDRTKKPFTILMIGVNGSGKTTTIGKLAAKLAASGHAVMLAAGDTFRAAAVEQLKVWGARTGAPVVVRGEGADAAGLAFDAVNEARAAGSDVLLIDTAGRLQNRTELMDELAKIIRVLRKVDAEAPHAVLLVLDATVGQNAMNQVEIFGRIAGVTGLVMTKLDGTARGGILVAIAEKFALPIHFIGVGEAVDDLEPFAARDFARAIAGLDDA